MHKTGNGIDDTKNPTNHAVLLTGRCTKKISKNSYTQYSIARKPKALQWKSTFKEVRALLTRIGDDG